MTDPTNRQLAEDSIRRALAQLAVMPHGPVPNDQMIAASTNAGAHATIAVAQALLDLAEAVREETR